MSVSTSLDLEGDRRKHFECFQCGKHYIKLGHLYAHMRTAKHMCVHCSHCGLDIPTWKDRLRHFVYNKHALLDGAIITPEALPGQADAQLLDPAAFKDDALDEVEVVKDFPIGWWDSENEVLVGILLSFRPNGTTTSKGLQKVLQLPYMVPLLRRILSTDGSLDSFLKRRKDIFQSEPMFKLRLKLPREEAVKALILASPHSQVFTHPIVAAQHPDERWVDPSPAMLKPTYNGMFRDSAASVRTHITGTTSAFNVNRISETRPHTKRQTSGPPQEFPRSPTMGTYSIQSPANQGSPPQLCSSSCSSYLLVPDSISSCKPQLLSPSPAHTSQHSSDGSLTPGPCSEYDPNVTLPRLSAANSPIPFQFVPELSVAHFTSKVEQSSAAQGVNTVASRFKGYQDTSGCNINAQANTLNDSINSGAWLPRFLELWQHMVKEEF